MNLRYLLLLPLLLASACSSGPPTIDSLANTPVAVTPKQDLKITRAQAMDHYRRFLKLAPDSPMYPQALKRLAELEILTADENNGSGDKAKIKKARQQAADAIHLYDTYLIRYPGDPDNDHILYQQAKAYELRGETDKTLATLQHLSKNYPNSRYFDEANFRRGEILFSQKHYAEAEHAFYKIGIHPRSPYREKALYKYAWSLFKQSHYDKALNAFFNLLDVQQEYGHLDAMDFPENISGTEKAMLGDIMRAISLAVSYQAGTQTLNTYLSRHQARQYEALLYNSLGKLYLRKQRYMDAADTFLAFVERHPDNILAPRFHQQAIEAFQSARLPHLVLPAKADFIKRYDRYSRFWMVHKNDAVRKQVLLQVNQHIHDLASYYHAASRKRHKKKDYQQAIYWYDYYLKSFPGAEDTPAVNFLLAEVLYESKNYPRAISEFERTAYQYPRNKKSAEAAYAALLIYPKIEKQAHKTQKTIWKQKAITSALRFSESFPKDKRALSVLANAVNMLDAMGDYSRARDSALSLTRKLTATSKTSLQRTAWLILGHASFELAEFKQAETAYSQALNYIPAKSKQKKEILNRLAASIYKQGEAAKKQGQLKLAIAHFLRIAKLAPASNIRLTADYDAASLLIQSNRLSEAQPLLEDLRRHYSKHSARQTGISTKLAYIYVQTGQSLKAARELEKLAFSNQAHSSTKEKRELLWQSAELYSKTKHTKDAARLYKKYIRLYPQPFMQALEARQNLLDYYQTRKNYRAARHWMKEIVKADQTASAQRSDRSRYLAAKASLQLAAPSRYAYEKVRLSIPLKKSLKKKKRLMKRSLKAYQRAMAYQVAEVSTQATYEIAEIYNNFSRALMKSQRPRKLTGEALEQYGILLEEQAYPFEEKAIDIHQANLKYMQQGIYDKWVKKSLKQLQKLQPIRYAKYEKIDSYVSSIY
ncbi:TPR domain protein, putative component of TonB system [hydrothermal vent metagenome]|uniref:TPR domain protein, putative component of TonB system n=1 Tax=hydrothermal vent metagenome TaxID=652676 RepID=A0A3B1B3T5_9ZZZZ